MSRGPIAADAATSMVATTLVADSTVVALTVTPAPKMTDVCPAMNWTLGEPAIRT